MTIQNGFFTYMKIPYSRYCQFQTEYYGGPMRLYLRFGQAFLNKFLPLVQDPNLFYLENNEDAQIIILDRYVGPITEETSPVFLAEENAALDRMANNARELHLDYDCPTDCENDK
jgi:hypothetical protein